MRKLISMGLVLLMLFCILPIAAFTDDTEMEKEEGNGEIIVLEDTDGEATLAEEELSATEPFVPDGVDKLIFGNDGRVTVSNPSSYPYSAIAYLEASAPCGCRWTGSGFMIGRDRLLTAAHCLVCTDHGTWANIINFYFGYKSAKNYAYRYNGRWTAWAGSTFEQHRYIRNNDYGCVRFYENVGDITGWFGTRFDIPDTELETNSYYVAGYRDGVLKYDFGKLEESSEDFLYFKMDMLAGNSGGPIFGKDYYVVGINIADNEFMQINIGYRVNDRVANCIGKT